MGEPIRSTSAFAHELADYISQHALSPKEVKSLANCIGFRIGFLQFFRRARLTEEMVYLYVFMGSLVLRSCFADVPYVAEDQVDAIVEQYKSRLLQQWIPERAHFRYEERRETWGRFCAGPDWTFGTPNLATSFLANLRGEIVEDLTVAVLTLRFNNYIRLFLGSVDNMIPDLDLA